MQEGKQTWVCIPGPLLVTVSLSYSVSPVNWDNHDICHAVLFCEVYLTEQVVNMLRPVPGTQ